MESREKAEKIIEYIEKVNDLIHKKHHDLAVKHNLTVDQFHLLLYLSRKSQPPTVGQIAQIFNNASNTMSEKLTRIEEKGLIKRMKDKKDRRISRIVITEKGKELIKSISYLAGKQFIFSSITNMRDESVDNLLKSLEELISHLKED